MTPEDASASDMSFREWLPARFPTWSWDWAYQKPVYDALDRGRRGESQYLAFFLHPRLGKSELVSVRFASYLLEQNPSDRIILGAYNSTFSSLFSRKARTIVTQGGVPLSKERNAANDWETVEGGGMYATGVGSGVTGRGGNWIIIDDPVKSRQEANSLAYRERVWNWYKDDLHTRREPGAVVILIMTLWHEDDLGMRLLSGMDDNPWDIVRIPALAETQAERDDFARKFELPIGQPDPLGREAGEATCPERFDVPELKKFKRTMGTSFDALYQQRPTAPSGSMFKREWFKFYDVLPHPYYPRRFVRYWDKAGQQDAGAYTAGVLLCEIELPKEEYAYYVVDVIMGQWEAATREQIIYETAVADNAAHPGMMTMIEQEPGSGGLESVRSTIKRLRGYIARRDLPSGDKVLRSEPVAAQAAIGNLGLIKGSWNLRYLDIITSFPHGTVKDPVDATSGGFNYFARGTEAGRTEYG